MSPQSQLHLIDTDKENNKNIHKQKRNWELVPSQEKVEALLFKKREGVKACEVSEVLLEAAEPYKELLRTVFFV